MSPLRARQFDRAFAFVSRQVEDQAVPCAILAVADAHRTLRCEAFGQQDGIPLTADDASPVFSITKPIVATAVSLLWERGLLQLHDSVAGHLPGFAVNGKDGILVRHLLTHTSGISEASAVEAMRSGGGREALHAAVLNAVMDAPAGTRQRYSNAAFVALGMIVERISGLSLDVFLQNEIFAPLGMQATTFDPERLVPRRVLTVPNFTDLGMSPDPKTLIALRLAAAGLFSTAADMVRFGQVFLNGGHGRGSRLLSPATCASMMAAQTVGIPPLVPGDFDGFSVGLGWYVPVAPNHKLISLDGVVHSGAGGCQIFVSPRWGICVTLVTARIRLRTERVLNAVLGCLG